MNAKELIARNKKFAVECVNLANTLPDTKLGNHIRGQLIRCSTSVAANYRATRLAQSKAAFIAKLSIVIEEADESEFWIEFGMEFNLFKPESASKLMKEARELTSIYIATRNSIRKGR
jgi:four helix bundle protein